MKNNSSSEQIFLDSLTHSSRIVYQRQCEITQINDNIKNPFNVFPNPLINNNLLTITSDKHHENYFIFLKDITGRTVFQKKLTGQQNDIDLSILNKGLYFVNIRTEDKIFSKKILLF
jgi:hypothetical protein